MPPLVSLRPPFFMLPSCHPQTTLAHTPKDRKKGQTAKCPARHLFIYCTKACMLPFTHWSTQLHVGGETRVYHDNATVLTHGRATQPLFLRFPTTNSSNPRRRCLSPERVEKARQPRSRNTSRPTGPLLLLYRKQRQRKHSRW